MSESHIGAIVRSGRKQNHCNCRVSTNCVFCDSTMQTSQLSDRFQWGVVLTDTYTTARTVNKIRLSVPGHNLPHLVLDLVVVFPSPCWINCVNSDG